MAVSSSSKDKLDKLRHWADVHKPKDKSDPDYFDVTSLIQMYVNQHRFIRVKLTLCSLFCPFTCNMK